MDSNEQLDERELEMIRQDMERKRAALADKLGALESQVTGTMQSATEAVGDAKEVITSVKETLTETAGAVKETVTDTVQSVTEALNVSRHVENHPWAAMGCAVATGFAGGLLIGGSREEGASEHAPTFPQAGWQPAPSHVAAGAPSPGSPSAEPREGVGAKVLDSLGETWERLTGGLQGLAVGALMGLARHMAERSLPSDLTGEVGRFLDDVTDKLGGKATALSQKVADYARDAIGLEDEDDRASAGEERRPPGRPASRPQPHNGPRQRVAR